MIHSPSKVPSTKDLRSPLSVLLPVSIGTCLSLLGDASLYAVLPTHTFDAGTTVASLGILLSINRFIRLALNGPIGLIYDRGYHRLLFVASLVIGAASTAIYGLTTGFWPLLFGRILWGLAWAGIWVGGNTIILEVAQEENRGRWMGIYQAFFFLGAASGALLGGVLTDLLGYHQAMLVNASLTFLGAFIALIFLPETHGLGFRTIMSEGEEKISPNLFRRIRFFTAMLLLGVNRLVAAGFLQATFGLYLLGKIGEEVMIAGRTMGVATLTGLALGVNTLVAMVSVPIVGTLSDRSRSRWQTAAGGLIPGIFGFGMLAIGTPLAIFFGIPLAAVTSGSNQGLSTTLAGEDGSAHRRSSRLGVMFTFGDFASAMGPLLAYALIPLIHIEGIYIVASSLFTVMFFVILWLATRPPMNKATSQLDQNS